MESFLRAVDDIAQRFGLETFFYVMDSDRAMNYLPEETQNFILADVISEHNLRLVENYPVTDVHATAPVDTLASILPRFKRYDAFERCDFSLSNFIIKSLAHPDLHAEVIVQHSHVNFFKLVPGHIYLMMTL